MVVLTQRLVQMQQAKAPKEQVDVAQHKEVVLKACVQPWMDEAFTITTDIEGKLAHIDAKKHSHHIGLRTTYATDPSSSSSVHY